MENDDFDAEYLKPRNGKSYKKRKKDYDMTIYNLSELSEKDRLYDGFVRIEGF